MNNKDKDLLGKEIKCIYEVETNDITMSSQLINNILNSREKTWRDKISDFLNKEIEIPLAPAIVGVAALLFITMIPKDIFKNNDVSIINIGSSQVIIRDYKDVSRK